MQNITVEITAKGYTGLTAENIEKALDYYFGSRSLKVSFSVTIIRSEKYTVDAQRSAPKSDETKKNRMKIISVIFLLLLSACSALPISVDGTPLPTQAAQTATASPIPTATIGYEATNQALMTQQADTQARLLASGFDLLTLQSQQVVASQVAEQNALEIIRITQSAEAAEAAYIPTSDFLRLLAYTAQAENNKAEEANRAWTVTAVQVAEDEAYIKDLPKIRTAEFSLIAVACLFGLAAAAWLVITSIRNWEQSELARALADKAEAEAERARTLLNLGMTEIAAKPEQPEQPSAYQPATLDRFAIPCTQEVWTEFTKYALTDGAMLGREIQGNKIFGYIASDYKSMREVMQANGWTVNTYGNNTLKLSDLGREIFIDWQNGDGLPDGYKFK